MALVVDFSPNTMPRIDKIWAFLSVDKDGNEGVCAAPMQGLGCVPLIASDQARVESLMPLAQMLARMSGMTIKLVEFSVRTELTEITASQT